MIVYFLYYNVIIYSILWELSVAYSLYSFYLFPFEEYYTHDSQPWFRSQINKYNCNNTITILRIISL